MMLFIITHDTYIDQCEKDQSNHHRQCFFPNRRNRIAQPECEEKSETEILTTTVRIFTKEKKKKKIEKKNVHFSQGKYCLNTYVLVHTYLETICDMWCDILLSKNTNDDGF
jgi:hypothetical protein